MSSMFAKCLKCNKEFVFYAEWAFKKVLREGCLSCHSKNLKWALDNWEEGKINFITDECPKCHQTKIMDITNWEEFKSTVIKKVGKDDKEATIKNMNENLEQTCYCSLISFNRRLPWVIGGGLVGLGLIIGLVIYLIKKKKQS